MSEPKIVRNERLKLYATYMNTVAVGFLVAGGIAPSVGLLSNENPRWEPFAVFLTISVTVSIALHMAAQFVLGGLED